MLLHYYIIMILWDNVKQVVHAAGGGGVRNEAVGGDEYAVDPGCPGARHIQGPVPHHHGAGRFKVRDPCDAAAVVFLRWLVRSHELGNEDIFKIGADAGACNP